MHAKFCAWLCPRERHTAARELGRRRRAMRKPLIVGHDVALSA